jgi:hypothetical protein
MTFSTFIGNCLILSGNAKNPDFGPNPLPTLVNRLDARTPENVPSI